MVAQVNGQPYIYTPPVTERGANPVYGVDNFFVNPPVGVIEYVPQDLFSGKTAGLSGLVANAPSGVSGGIDLVQNLAPQAGYSAGVSTQSWVG